MINNTNIEFSQDDLFLLGNIGLTAVIKGYGEQARSILRFVQHMRPNNASGFLSEALYLYSIDETENAIRLLDDSSALYAEFNRDEAIAFHLFLLQQKGDLSQVIELGETYIAENLVISDVALHAINTVLDETRRIIKEQH